MQKKRLRQVVDSDLAASYGEEEDYSPARSKPSSSRPLIPPASHGSISRHNPMHQATAFAIIAAIILVVILLLFNWSLFLTYGPWFLLGVSILAAGVVIALVVNRSLDGKSDRSIKHAHARAINARAKQIEDTLPFDDNGNLYDRIKGYIAGQAPEYP